MININGTLINAHRVTVVTPMCVFEENKKYPPYTEKSIQFVCDSVPIQISVRRCESTISTERMKPFVQYVRIGDLENCCEITQDSYDNFEEKCKLLYELKQF